MTAYPNLPRIVGVDRYRGKDAMGNEHEYEVKYEEAPALCKENCPRIYEDCVKTTSRYQTFDVSGRLIKTGSFESMMPSILLTT